MKTKTKALLCVAMALCLCVTILTACNNGSNLTHEHTLFDFEQKPVTCLEDGIKAHKYCLYCQKMFIDGKEVKADDIVIKSNPDVHNLVSHDLVQSTCATAGMLSHQQCADCHRIFVDGDEKSAEQLILPYGDHSWGDGSLECANCNAYKLLYNGDYTVIDSANRQQFVSHPMGATHTTDARPNYIAAWWENRMTFSTQNGSGSTVTNVDGNIWRIAHTKGVGSFTRVAYGEGDQAYIGKVLLSFDVTVNSTEKVQRLGVKVVDGIKADAYANGNYSKLLGSHKDEENNAQRTFIPGTVYRFVYMLELTEEEQLIQFFTASDGGAITFDIFNVHFVNIDEELTGVPTALLVSFGTADDEPVAKEDCTHAFAYDVNEVEPNCIREGNIAYNHCPQCGLNTVDGSPVDNVKKGKTAHEYGALVTAEESTCTEQGHDAYYKCAVCENYFAEDHTPLEGKPMRQLKDHTLGSWENNADGHWKTCSECHQQLEQAEHIPGPEATDDEPQICTECEFIITPALTHKHAFGEMVEEQPATCDDDGHVAYYYCDGCKKYYEDNEGNKEITDIVLTKLGHAFDSLVKAKDPTCTEDGNEAYYYCSQCNKYFDESQQNDITATYVRAKLNHAGIESHDVTPATCYQRGSERSYYYCPNCNKYFENDNGSGELAPEDIFTLPFEAHDFSTGDTCANSGCNMTRVKDSMESCGASGADKSVIYPALNGKPGTWAAQSTNANSKPASSGTFSNGVLSGWVNTGNKNANKLFVRVNPSQDGATKFIGTFLWVLEFKVTEALGNNTNAANLAISFCIKNSLDGDPNYDKTIGGWDGNTDSDYFNYEVGHTYYFAVIMEITGDYQVGQINIRNGANSGAYFEISNSYFAFYPAIANTGSNTVEKVDGYGQDISALTASYDMPVAVLPSKKYDYVR